MRTAFTVVLVVVAACKSSQMTPSQYEAKSTELFDGIAEILVAPDARCDGLAKGLGYYFDDHESDIQHVAAYGAAHPDEVAAYQAKAAPRIAEKFGTKASAALVACGNDPSFKAVWARFGM